MTTNHEARNYFQLHVDHSQTHKKHDEVQHEKQSQKSQEPSRNVQNEKRTVKEILKDTFRQLAVSFVILVIGVVLINFQAYSQIAKSKWQDFFGTQEVSPLEEIVRPQNDIKYTKTVLKTSNNPEVQKKQIPALNLEVAPSDNRIIIPRINQNIPIVRVDSESLIKRDWGALEKDMQEALRGGVVHYPGTSLPGQSGNIAITGHSSYFPWDPGRFKDVFALLHKVVEGDHIVIYWDQKKYVYEVNKITIVLPDDIEILKQTPTDKLTLITCTPVGTNLKRLIVEAVPVKVEELDAVVR
ncbi:class E sortase [Candidatus Peregrinibacteria bacterium]|nr:class E sortase [Candidatus Peregrinibacteria bacterium]